MFYALDLGDLELIPSVGTVAAFVVSFGILWKLGRWVFKIDRALPVVLQIADEFKPNGGNSLRDQITKINTKLDAQHAENKNRLDELEVADRFTTKIAEDSRLVAQTNAAIVKEIAATQADDVAHIKEYMHTKMHELNNSIVGFQLHALHADERSRRIEERLDKLLPLVVRTRQSFPDHSDNEEDSAQ